MTATRNLIVGITALLGLAGLATTLLLLGEYQLTPENRFPATLQLLNAQGITPGTPVTLNGVVVGKVDQTTVNADPTQGVTVDLLLNQGTNVPRKGLLITTSLSLVGASTLDIKITDTELAKKEGFIQAGDVINADAYTLFEQIENIFDDKLQPFTEAAIDVSATAQTFNSLGERLNGFVTPDPGQPQIDFLKIFNNLDAAIAGAREYLEDDELRASIESAAANASSSFDNANAAITEVQAAAETVRTNIAELSDAGSNLTTNLDTRSQVATDAFVESARQLDETLSDLRDTLAQINEGEGTVGMLMQNPDLYNSINDASVRLEEMLLEATNFLRKYRTEGVEVQLF